MTFQPNVNTVVPAFCSHGMSWALPCASCGRPFVPPAQVASDAALFDLAAAIRELAAAVRAQSRQDDPVKGDEK